MISWDKRAHFQNVGTEHILPPGANDVDGPSSATWGQMAMAMFVVKQLLVAQTEDKKSRRN